MSCLILSISGVYMATLRRKHICHVCIFVRSEVSAGLLIQVYRWGWWGCTPRKTFLFEVGEVTNIFTSVLK